MTDEIEFTLKQLAQIALGAPEVNSYNISVLHTLLNLILKKLNCEDEKVKIGACESNYLQNILDKSKISTISFNEENIEMLSEKICKIEKLDKRVIAISSRLDEHISRIQRPPRLNDTLFKWGEEDVNFNPLEDFCTVCDENNKIACELLNNVDFLKKLIHRVSAPVVERMFEFEAKILKLSKELNSFIDQMCVIIEKVGLAEKCADEILELRNSLQVTNEKQMCIMEEVQEILDSKVNKHHIPSLKKYIADRLSELENKINALQTKEDCPKAAGVLMSLTCAICGGIGRGAEVGEHGAPILPDFMGRKLNKSLQNSICEPDCKKLKSLTDEVPLHKSTVTFTGKSKSIPGNSKANEIFTCVTNKR